jgi:hypothetical protein
MINAQFNSGLRAREACRAALITPAVGRLARSAPHQSLIRWAARGTATAYHSVNPKSLLHLLLGFALLCTSCGPVLSEQERAAILATKAAETSLTSAHGTEARSAIENYEAEWMSLEAHKNPTTQSRLATGGYLWYWGYARMGEKVYDEPFWLITKSATVTNLRVLEYSPDRFKAIASVKGSTDKITPKGEFIESLPKPEYCLLYLFIREDGAWKVADLFDITSRSEIERDWANNVAWEKEVLGQPILGDLPQADCYGDSIP